MGRTRRRSTAVVIEGLRATDCTRRLDSSDPEEKFKCIKAESLASPFGASHSVTATGKLPLKTLKSLLNLIHADISLRQLYLSLTVSLLIFVFYLAVMHLQFQDVRAFEVLATARTVLVPPAYVQFMPWLRTQIVNVWIDPTCGDGICQSPNEFPSFGRFGCRADCGAATDTSDMLVYVEVNFENMDVSARIREDLWKRVRWNLCGDIDEQGLLRTSCWYENDQRLVRLRTRWIEKFSIRPGKWYIRVSGDPARAVRGRVMDMLVVETGNTSVQDDGPSAKANILHNDEEFSQGSNFSAGKRHLLSGTLETRTEYTNCINNIAGCTSIHITKYQLVGTIPTEIGTFTSLAKLELSINSIVGTLPTELGSLTGLTQM
ncbi:hypothetical protein CYMTET_48503 [Cymbomonas tetramitiformis]|uniref:L domain-like protein n=1 Tax=Cymbomonas tetramitiformis TaxID=36881 RepID=A0AAE0BSB0_9CHLO|nr:hypothetical protein CYMTET_48503 [Cymbomonas tetramitiformis]